jgi:hypothetical protein
MSITTVVPNIDFAMEHKDVHLVSPQDVTMRQFPSTDINNNNQSSFNCPPAGLNMITDKCIYLAMPVTITYSGTISSGTGLLQTGYDAFRGYPIASITNNINVMINNISTQLPVSDIIPYLMARFSKQKIQTVFPNYPDTYQNYIDGVTAVNNPLGAYFNQIEHYNPRGAYPCIVINGSTSSSISATIYEPLWLPLFSCETDNGLGLTNVQNMQVVLTFNTNLARIVSHAVSSRVTLSGEPTVQLGTGKLFFKYNLPTSDYVPRSVEYACNKLDRSTTNLGTPLTPNQYVTSFASSNQQIPCIPEWMLLFVRESNANLKSTMSDSAAVIDGINITFCGKSGILASATQIDLYNMSKENGLRDLYEQFIGYTTDQTTGNKIPLTGSFLMLKFGKNISLAPATYIGQNGSWNLQVTLAIHNQSSTLTILDPVMYMVLSSPQKVIFDVGGYTRTVIGFPQEDMNKGSQLYMPYSNAYKQWGGGFNDFISKIMGLIGTGAFRKMFPN